MTMNYLLIRKKWFYEDAIDYLFIDALIYTNSKLIDLTVDTFISAASPLSINVDFEQEYTLESQIDLGNVLEFEIDEIEVLDHEVSVGLTLGNYVYSAIQIVFENLISIDNLDIKLNNAVDFSGYIDQDNAIDLTTNVQIGFPLELQIYTNLGNTITQTLEMELQAITKTYIDLDPIVITNYQDLTLDLGEITGKNINIVIALPTHEINTVINCYSILKFSDLYGIAFYQIGDMQFKDLYLKTW